MQLERKNKEQEMLIAKYEGDMERQSRHIAVLDQRVQTFEKGVEPPSDLYTDETYQLAKADYSSKQPSVSLIAQPPAIDNAMSEEIRLEAELGILEGGTLEVQLKLSHMAHQRALYGTQMDDATAAMEAALKALESSMKLGDDAAIARANFWLGVALYYNNDISTARDHFQAAVTTNLLPPYEAEYLEGWLDRCNEDGPEKDAAVYRGNIAFSHEHSPEKMPKDGRDLKLAKDKGEEVAIVRISSRLEAK